MHINATLCIISSNIQDLNIRWSARVRMFHLPIPILRSSSFRLWTRTHPVTLPVGQTTKQKKSQSTGRAKAVAVWYFVWGLWSLIVSVQTCAFILFYADPVAQQLALSFPSLAIRAHSQSFTGLGPSLSLSFPLPWPLSYILLNESQCTKTTSALVSYWPFTPEKKTIVLYWSSLSVRPSRVSIRRDTGCALCRVKGQDCVAETEKGTKETYWNSSITIYPSLTHTCRCKRKKNFEIVNMTQLLNFGLLLGF